MPTHDPTELSRIKLKTWTQQPIPMMSEHSAHLTSLPFGFRTWLWRYTCLLLLISMLWLRQAIFESKGDKLSSSAESRIRTWKSQRHLIASRLNAHSQTDWAIEDQAKKLELNSSSRRCSGTGKRYSNRKETSCLPLLRAGFEPRGSLKPNLQQTECLLTNQLSYRGSSLKTWTRQLVPMISKHSAHLTPLPLGIRTWLWRYTYLLLLISMLWHRQAIFESQGDKLSSSAESRIRTQGGSET